MRSYVLVAFSGVVFIVGLAVGLLIRSNETQRLIGGLQKLKNENLKLTTDTRALTEELNSLKKELTEKNENVESSKPQIQVAGGSKEKFEQLRKELADTKEQLRQTREVVTFLRSKFPLYRVVRKAPLFRNATEEGQTIMLLSPNHRIRIERVVDDKWLKVLYSNTNPPGYVRKEDAVPISP